MSFDNSKCWNARPASWRAVHGFEMSKGFLDATVLIHASQHASMRFASLSSCLNTSSGMESVELTGINLAVLGLLLLGVLSWNGLFLLNQGGKFLAVLPESPAEDCF